MIIYLIVICGTRLARKNALRKLVFAGDNARHAISDFFGGFCPLFPTF
jgi:hypothetical protein